MPFLSVVTRCYKRPEMLANNTASLARQTDRDFEQIFLIDDEGMGIGDANRVLMVAEPTGDYVMVLDDDDWMINDRAVELLREATIESPDMVIFKADHKGLGILPSKAIWEKRPLKGHIGSCDFITRRDVWEKYIHRFGVDEGGDYAFLHAVWMDSPVVIWLDELLAGIQRPERSNGAPE